MWDKLNYYWHFLIEATEIYGLIFIYSAFEVFYSPNLSKALGHNHIHWDWIFLQKSNMLITAVCIKTLSYYWHYYLYVHLPIMSILYTAIMCIPSIIENAGWYPNVESVTKNEKITSSPVVLMVWWANG